MADPIPGVPGSLLNPTDLAGMKQQGVARPGMTVRDFMQKMGIDVDGPVEQLQQFARKQTQNATAMGKMNTMAARGPQQQMGGRPPGGPGPTAPRPTGGLNDLLSNVG